MYFCKGEKIKVLLLTPDFPPAVGGIQKLLYNYAKYTKSDLTVMAPFSQAGMPDLPGVVKSFDKTQGFKVLRIPKSRSKLWVLVMLLKVIKIAAKEKLVVLFCGHIVVGPIGYIVKKLFGIPYIIYIYGLEIFITESKIKSFILRHALIVFVINEFCRNRLLKLGVREDNIKKL
ncbi:MAG: hypothetical protein HY769_02055 [Candidatus Stahlbacteria bacterium]|nr:hypothetical protein [Candidatus Stahlbacteria bacterium]